VKHHHRPDGTVKISARELDSTYEFSIADDGPGIDPAYHEKIFTIFQTLKARDELESTGIGLSLVKKIVTAEGGRVSIESEPEKGAIFRFTWPKSPNQRISFA
ncbi:MAG: ATP-binding protein, partial [Phormidesmis sp.]